MGKNRNGGSCNIYESIATVLQYISNIYLGLLQVQSIFGSKFFKDHPIRLERESKIVEKIVEG